MASSILGGGGSTVDVLLVYPAYETILERRGRFLTTIPLGIAYLASSLESNGFSVRVLDLNINRKLSLRDIASRISDINPRILCFSLTSMGLRQGYRVQQELKTSCFKGVVVVGGPHVTADPEVVGEFGADYGIMGEAEHALPALCRFILRGGGRPEDIGGLVKPYRGGIKYEECQRIEDLDELPPPARHLFEIKKYNYVSIITSRGCPFGCSYCTTANTKTRQRSVENVYSEIEGVVSDLNPGFIAFVDNVFTLEEEFVSDLCGRIEAGMPELRWSCATRADSLDERLIQVMHSAGCERISFGVESGVERIRLGLGKKITNKQYEKVFSACRKAGIKTSAYFMLGNPGEKKGDMDDTVNFALKLDPDDVFFTPTIVLPKTYLFEDCVREGRIGRDVWVKFMKDAADIPYIIPDEFQAYTVDSLQLYAMRKYFLDLRYVGRRFSRSRSAGEVIETGKLISGVFVDRVFIRKDIIPYDL